MPLHRLTSLFVKALASCTIRAYLPIASRSSRGSPCFCIRSIGLFAVVRCWFRTSTHCFNETFFMEINPILNQLADLQARTDMLRGYL